METGISTRSFNFKRWLKWLVLAAALLFLIGIDVSGEFMAPHLGTAGTKLRSGLHAPLFSLGHTPITPLFLIQIAIFVSALVLISRFVMGVLERRVLIHTSLASAQQYAVSRILSYSLFTVGVLIGLQLLGLNLSSLVVVGGALGLGIGLGLQPILTNFVAGVILLVEQPVRVGDRIEVGDLRGDVIAIKGRSTWVRTNDNIIIIVPNSEFIEKEVRNWTANDRRVRIRMPVGVAHGSDPEMIREMLVREAEQHPDALQDPAPNAIFLGYGYSRLNFELRIWTERQVQTPERLKSDLYFSIWRACKQAGVEIAFPQRDLHIRSISKEAAGALMGDPGKKPESIPEAGTIPNPPEISV